MNIMKTKNEHTIQPANEQQRPNGSAVSEDLRKAGERVDRLVEEDERWSAHRLQRALAWAVVVLANMSGWFLILGPIEIESTVCTSLGHYAALAAYCTAAVLLVVASTVGAARLLPEDFFEE